MFDFKAINKDCTLSFKPTEKEAEKLKEIYGSKLPIDSRGWVELPVSRITEEQHRTCYTTEGLGFETEITYQREDK